MVRPPRQIAVLFSGRIIAGSLFIILLACLGQPTAAETDRSETALGIPAHLLPAVEQAIANGRDMYAASLSPAGNTAREQAMFDANKGSGLLRYCDVPVIENPGRDNWTIPLYIFNGPMPPYERDQLGYVDSKNVPADIVSEPLPNGCAFVSLRNNSIRLLTTQLHTPTPTEADVFESLRRKKSFYLSSSDGTVWWVRGDSITIVR